MRPGNACKTFDAPACVIVKHANPCGVAVGAHLVEAYGKAWKTDPTSAYGGILAFNRPVDEATARQIGDNKQFVEVLIAPGFTPEARALFAAKQNLRVLEVPLGNGSNALDFKRVGGGMLLQTPDLKNVARAELRVVTKLAPDAPQQMDDLLFAWKVAKFVKSNAIVFCGGGMTLGVGAGQMSRVDSARIARIKAGNAGPVAGRFGAWPATPSSPSATAWTWSSTKARPASSSRAARCATTRSSPPPTNAASPWSSPARGISVTDPQEASA